MKKIILIALLLSTGLMAGKKNSDRLTRDDLSYWNKNLALVCYKHNYNYCDGSNGVLRDQAKITKLLKQTTYKEEQGEDWTPSKVGDCDSIAFWIKKHLNYQNVKLVIGNVFFQNGSSALHVWIKFGKKNFDFDHKRGIASSAYQPLAILKDGMIVPYRLGGGNEAVSC